MRVGGYVSKGVRTLDIVGTCAYKNSPLNGRLRLGLCASFVTARLYALLAFLRYALGMWRGVT
jgi:hypothetical protein